MRRVISLGLSSQPENTTTQRKMGKDGNPQFTEKEIQSANNTMKRCLRILPEKGTPKQQSHAISTYHTGMRKQPLLYAFGEAVN